MSCARARAPSRTLQRMLQRSLHLSSLTVTASRIVEARRCPLYVESCARNAWIRVAPRTCRALHRWPPRCHWMAVRRWWEFTRRGEIEGGGSDLTSDDDPVYCLGRQSGASSTAPHILCAARVGGQTWVLDVILWRRVDSGYGAARGARRLIAVGWTRQPLTVPASPSRNMI